MKFGEFPLEEVEGSILAHSVRLPDDTVIKKGTLLDEDLVDLMFAASMETVTVALLEEGDVREDEAARLIAEKFGLAFMRTDEARTGRVNFFASKNGVFRVSKDRVDALNRLDPGITFATLPDYAEVNDGRMVATVKIIPYAVSKASIEKLNALDMAGAIALEPYHALRIGLIQTMVPGTKQSILDKTRKNLERRLLLSGSTVEVEERVVHRTGEVNQALEKIVGSVDMIILFGASAISDEDDVIPAAIRSSGGEVDRFGMPVDPGNLLMLGKLGGHSVIGAPGCARAPKENGFDWVLQRLLAGLAVTSDDIAGLGVGGLLMETGARPHPREARTTKEGAVRAVVLAAGQSRRMGNANKMTVAIEGKAMVRHVVESALASNCTSVSVVTGHEPEDIHSALEGLSYKETYNPDFAEGLSSSLRAGVAASQSPSERLLVLLGDMPHVTADHINALIEASNASPSKIVMATASGKRGNPVIWPSRYFDELSSIEGDVGARHIIAANLDDVIEVEIGDAAAVDLDTPEAVASYQELN